MPVAVFAGNTTGYDYSAVNVLICCLLLIIVLLLGVFFRVYKSMRKQRVELEYLQNQIKDIESLNQYKLRFFTNISHEFHTPLTAMIDHLEQLLQMESFTPSAHSRILNVYKNGVQLQSLVTELLDFPPQESVDEGEANLIPTREDCTHPDANLKEGEEGSPLVNEEDMHFPRVLIVENDERLRTVLTDIFQPYYHVELAVDGREGLEKVKALQPHIVISDVLMPGMSGVELCESIKNNADTCHIPVVLLTARTTFEHKQEGHQHGADDYIEKPFDVNILLASCRSLVNGRIALQEKFNKQPQVTAQVHPVNPQDKMFIDKAMAVVERNMDNTEFNVTQFAQEMAIARTKLFVKLKAITGQTPNDFILTVRMNEVLNLLKTHPELNISEISDRTGFSSPRYFSRAFKERFNQTPQMYRKCGGQGTD